MRTEKPDPGILKILILLLEKTEGFDKSFIFENDKKKHVCIIKKHRRKRTIQQNKLYWMWLNALSDNIGTDADSLHEILKNKLLVGENRFIKGLGACYISGTTKDLDTKEFTEYLNKIQEWSNSFLNYRLPCPEDIGWDEFYESYGL